MSVMADSSGARDKFVEGSQAVSLDAFLAWAPSMLSLLDEDVGEALVPMLQVCQLHEPCSMPVAGGIPVITSLPCRHLQPWRSSQASNKPHVGSKRAFRCL